MDITGGCYCKEIRYTAKGDPKMFQCHCRECQYITGGYPNAIMVLPQDNVVFTKGSPQEFCRTDIEKPVTRLFCGTCGTGIGTHKNPFRPGMILIKVGTFDDPSIFKPEAAIFTIDKQNFHTLPAGLPAFNRRP
tara:strand:- start:424 stop:825 length:402 start_codon:yes stop_codon:yes gene_type:complete